MSEWWTYTLSDFLLFSPRAYYRLFERLNTDLWPGHVLALGLGLLLLAMILRDPSRSVRIQFGIAAALWIFVAIEFLLRRYGTINWASRYFAGAFLLEASLLLLAGFTGKRRAINPPSRLLRYSGVFLLGFSVVIYPVIASLAGRPWRQAEVFGLAPDPTVVATLGLALISCRRWWCLTVPLLWCLLTGATILAMASPDAWVAPLAGITTVAVLVAESIRRRQVHKNQ
jgi:hypothetical protein